MNAIAHSLSLRSSTRKICASIILAFCIALGTFAGAAAEPAFAKNVVFSLRSPDNLQDSWTAKELTDLPAEQIHFKQGYSWNATGHYTIDDPQGKLTTVRAYENGVKSQATCVAWKNAIDISNRKHYVLISEANSPITITLHAVAFDNNKNDIDVKLKFTRIELWSYSTSKTEILMNPLFFRIGASQFVTNGSFLRTAKTASGETVYFADKMAQAVKDDRNVLDNDTMGHDVVKYVAGGACCVVDYSYSIDLVYSDGTAVSDDKMLFCTLLDIDNENENIVFPKTALTTGSLDSLYFNGREADKKNIDQNLYTSNASTNNTIAARMTPRAILKDRTVVSWNATKETWGSASPTKDTSNTKLYFLGTSGKNNAADFNAKHFHPSGTVCSINTTKGFFYNLDGTSSIAKAHSKSDFTYYSDFHYCDHAKGDPSDPDYIDAITAGWTLTLRPHTGTINQQQQMYSGSMLLQQLPPSTIAAKVMSGKGEIANTDISGTTYKAGDTGNETNTKVYWKRDQAYTITPAQYYRIKSVSTGNGSDITDTSAKNNLTVTNANKAMSYNFSSVTSDKQIVAAFERIPAQLTINKDADSFEYKPGETVTYTIEVGNGVAESAAFNTVITDAVPSDLTVTGVQASGVTGLTATHDGNDVTATCPQLPYGQTATVTISAVAKESGNGKHVTNTATAKCDNPVTPGTVSDTDKVWINSSRLNVTKSVKRYEYQIGERAEFTIGVYDPNAKSGSIAKGITITDEQLPANFKIDMETIKVTGIPDSVQYPIDGKSKETFETKTIKHTVTPKAGENGFTIDIPYLPATAVVTVTYEAIAQSDINGLDALNSVHVTTSDPKDPGDDSSTRIWVNNARMRIIKSTEQFEHQVGDVVKYTLDVSNMAPGTIAKNVIVKDISLPVGATLIPGSIAVTGVEDPINYTVMTKTDSGVIAQGTEQRFNKVAAAYADGTSFNASLVDPVPAFDKSTSAGHGNGFIVNIPYVASSDDVKITYYVRYDAETNGKLVENTATVSCDNKVPDQPKEELTSKAVVYVNTPNMTIYKKTTTPDAKVGDKAHYILTVKNANEGTIAGTPVVISDTLPDELTLDADSITVIGVPESVTYPVGNGDSVVSEEQRENTCDVIPNDDGKAFEIDIAYVPGNGAEIVVEYDAVVEEDAYGKTLTNIASVTDPREPNSPEDDETVYVRSDKEGYQTTLYKSATPDSGSLVLPGQEIEYTLTLKNTGNAMVPFTHIRDYIPQGATFVSASEGGEFVLPGSDADDVADNADADDAADAAADDEMAATEAGDEANVDEDAGAEASESDGLATSRVSLDCGRGYVEWVIADIAPNSEISVTYTVKLDGISDEAGESSDENTSGSSEADSADAIDAALPKYIRNVARYQTSVEDPGLPGEIASDDIPERESNEVLHATDPTHPAPAVLDVEKRSEPAPGSTVYNTDSIAYTLVVKNNGGADARNAFIRDVLDEKVELIAGSITRDGAYDADAHCIEWLLASVPAGGEVEVSFNVTVVDARPNDIISNQAQFDMDWDKENDADRQPANSTNIVEHISAGDYEVADKYVEKDDENIPDEMIAEEETPLSVISALGDAGIAVMVLGSALAFGVMLAWGKRRRDER